MSNKTFIKFGKDDQWRKIRGKLPQKREIPDWSPEKLLYYVRFIEDFTEKDPDNPKKDDNFICTPNQIRVIQEKSQEIPYYQEFLARIDVEPPTNTTQNPPDKTYNPFHARFITFARTPLTFLKQNPQQVTPDMFNIMSKNDRMSWATRHFTLFTNEVGTTVVMDTQEITDPKKPNYAPNSQTLQSPQVMFNESLYELAKIYQTILKDIKPQDLRKLTTNQKLQHVNTLTKTLITAFNSHKPDKATFTQININSASKDDLESAVLHYNQNQ